MTKFQLAGKPGHRPTEHLYVILSLIGMAQCNKESYLDVSEMRSIRNSLRVKKVTYWKYFNFNKRRKQRQRQMEHHNGSPRGYSSSTQYLAHKSTPDYFQAERSLSGTQHQRQVNWIFWIVSIFLVQTFLFKVVFVCLWSNNANFSSIQPKSLKKNLIER